MCFNNHFQCDCHLRSNAYENTSNQSLSSKFVLQIRSNITHIMLIRNRIMRDVFQLSSAINKQQQNCWHSHNSFLTHTLVYIRTITQYERQMKRRWPCVNLIYLQLGNALTPFFDFPSVIISVSFSVHIECILNISSHCNL